jgi:hypothetical protein
MVKLFGCLDPRVVAMLAEIFMMRLEAAPRPPQEILPSSTSQFVPFNENGQFTFKEGKNRRVVESTPKSTLRRLGDRQQALCHKRD